MDSDYADALTADGRDLSREAGAGTLTRPRFRDEEVARVLSLLDQGRSVLLVGEAGVGKTAVIHGLVHAVAERSGGRSDARAGGRVARVIELSTATLMAGTRYLGEWQTKVRAVAEAAVRENAALFVPDAWNLPSAGRTSNSDTNVLDALRPYLEQGRLVLVAEATPAVLRQMERTPRFADLFEKIELRPLSDDHAAATVQAAAEHRGLKLDDDVVPTLLDLTGRFLPARPQPGPALDLLAHVAERVTELPPHTAVPKAFVARVFAEHSGLPDFIVRRDAVMKAADIRTFFSERLVGQQAAIEAVVECIALFKAGLQDPRKPLGTFLFVGPTGVGKTELARTLAEFLFGSRDRLLRFDLGEYKDYHSFQLLLGDPRDPGRPAALVDPVRAQPFQVILLDELEKAHPNVWDVLLGLLDEGRLTPPAGEPVDFRSTIVICTSNVGALGSDRRLGFGEGPDNAAREAAIRTALEQQFRPEFLNRFQQVVVFHALSREQVRGVARQELSRVLRRQGITDRGLVVEVDDGAIDLAIEEGFDERYGARALTRELQRTIVLPLAMAIMEGGPDRGQLVRVQRRGARVGVDLLSTPEVRARAREARPVRVDGRALTHADLVERAAAMVQAAEALSHDAHRPALVEERDRLRVLRQEPDFWKAPREAARDLRDLDRIERALDRLGRLEQRANGLVDALRDAASRDERQRLAPQLQQLEQHLASARRDLVVLGRAGAWDALVELAPVGGPAARDLVAGIYVRWGRKKGHGVDWLRVPTEPEEPALLALRGPSFAGLLADEAGLHRLVAEEGSCAVRVRVAPWTDAVQPPQWGEAKARKAVKGLPEPVRSRLEVGWRGRGRTAPLVLQGNRTIDEARALAHELLGSWVRLAGTADTSVRVRTYDTVAGSVKDYRAGTLALHPTLLKPKALHALLQDRVDLRPEP
ncbi:MAG: AAA family ATPase [Alphaproteobacteria bacterium]|nr:AAA family ATPase [Alphaproteobacteria bacterium]